MDKMSSHKLAHLLLARRDNDVMVRLTDRLDTEPSHVQPHGVTYNATSDQIEILARIHYDIHYD